MSIHNRLRVIDAGVRAWPYPFRAAASISNDIDFCGFEFFEAFMRYCNTRESTPFGEGLGIEVTSSFFGFSRAELQFSYFDGMSHDAALSSVAPRLGEYLSAGWLDANHAFGDFDGAGGFVRAHAERFYEEMYKVGGDVRIFINHGDDFNYQCVGPGSLHHRGDQATSSEYHTDLMDAERPWFVTTSVHSIGHVDEAPPPASDLRKSKRGFFAAKPLFRDQGGSLIRPYILQDGRPVTAFMRLRGTGYNAPNLGSLTYQTALIDFDDLYAEEGVVVLYQHWGVLHRVSRRCHSATIEAGSRRSELFAGLRGLAREARGGKLWVAGLQRLLDYSRMVESVSIVPQVTPGEVSIISSVKVSEPDQFFAGLTVYYDPSTDVRLTFNGHILPIQYNGPDQDGLYTVSVPIIPKENIW